ncbi:amidohydrolase family protein [Mariniblastus fucicola]|uniref:Imidazolonepropionase n=1 Tax=Mariniblastus fucicola TaxID=980251 RepID=A0A5B9PET0_9BACT|nr:amidohydrolase family protein [Mariniblastus fucicola]QEG24039.1 imidazolonepropionase [Mariniblastus fucicola]
MPVFKSTANTLIFLLAMSSVLFAQSVDLPKVRNSRQVEGLYKNDPQLVAITGAMVTRFPGDEPSVESILIRNESIEAIGAGLTIPASAKTVDATGLHIYAGLIDAFHEIEVPFEADRGTGYWNDQVRPQVVVAESFKLKDLKTEDKRKAGFSTILCAPSDGVIKGQSALILMLDEEANQEEAVINPSFAHHFQLTVSRGRDSYPNSPMGAVALARQAMYDAKWYREASNSRAGQTESNDALQSLMLQVQYDRPAIFETSNELFSLRADRFAREFGLKNAILLGNGYEYRRIGAIAKTQRPIILPVNFPKPPEVGTPENAANVTLESLMHWEHAPKNPSALAKADVSFCLTSHGLKEDDNFLDKVRLAVKHGLSKSDALAAMTITPAKLFLADKLGKVESGFLANLVVTDKPLFEEDAQVVQTWVAGKQFETEDPKSDAVVWDVSTDAEAFAAARIQIDGQKIEIFKDADTGKKLKHSFQSESSIGGSFNGKDFGVEGWVQLSVTLIGEDSGVGDIVLPDGESIAIKMAKSEAGPLKKDDDEKDDDEKDDDEKDDDEEDKDDEDKDASKDGLKDIAAISKVNFPFGYAGVDAPVTEPDSVLIKDVTLWTCAADGVLENAAVLVSDGRIQSVFQKGVALPTADTIIDGTGMHLTPGIIDCHSHMATDSGVNESGQAITAEVRIGDMIDCDDMTIYRQLAGGVTTANILHGSANPIGGQNQVIKLRWGALDEEMKFKGAPEGVKFALGENVKQSNWDNPTNRYPQTRMGVEQIFDNAFEEAKTYRAKQQEFKTTGKGIPPRINLELEAIAEIVEGTRWIHCHSYRQDEILALIRLLDDHQIQIGTFQHILEGYKVADEMKKHGAMASAFADWWAYKYEVKDAIPHAGALMHQQGIVMSFNSDDRELGRRLNQEAAKAVRFGGLSFEEALKFVTINPAKQLRIENRVGSIEVGKDADLVLWNAHPLSNLAVAQQTWIDGKKYYDRDEDQQRHESFAKLKQQLVQKVLRSGEEMENEDAESTDPAKLWPRHDAFCGHQHHEGHDHDDHE